MAEADVATRLDRFLAGRLGIPRNQIQRWIEDGRVEIAGRPARSSESLRAGDEITWRIPPPRDSGVEPEAGELRILHEDEWLLAIDKPAGLAVHPGAGRSTGTLVHRLLARHPELAGVGGPGRPGIVHRLDLGTSGVLVVARTPRAYSALARTFAERKADKRYLAIVWGVPRPPAGRIEAPLGRHPNRRKEIAVVATGRPAVSEYATVRSAGGISLLAVRIETGRTHQIRVHLRHRGWPIVGDPLYGEARWKAVRDPSAREALRHFARPALHAARLTLPHPSGEGILRLEAPVPDDLLRLWREATGESWPLPAPASVALSGR